MTHLPNMTQPDSNDSFLNVFNVNLKGQRETNTFNDNYVRTHHRNMILKLCFFTNLL